MKVSATKAGVVMVTRVKMAELGRWGRRVGERVRRNKRRMDDVREMREKVKTMWWYQKSVGRHLREVSVKKRRRYIQPPWVVCFSVCSA